MKIAPLLLPALLLPLAACSDDTPTTEPSALASPSPSTVPSSEAASPTTELDSVSEDANRVTPPLESYFRSAGYAMTIEEAVEGLAATGLTLSEGNTVGGYVYDDAATEFKLCIEGSNGAHATYDTSPMSLFETGESGGCPS